MRKHYFIAVLILSAILVGIIYVGPQLFIKSAVEKSGGVYLPAQYTIETNELEMDLPRAREIYDGHFPPSEVFLDRRLPMPLNPLPVFLLSLPIFLFGGDLPSAYLLTQFIFSSLVFLGFCLCGWILTRNKVWTLFFGFIGVLTPLARFIPKNLFSWDNFLNLTVKNFYPLVKSPLEFIFLHKVVDPLITFTIFLPAIAILIYFWIRPNRPAAILGGILAGLLFYTYWHYWVYLIIVVGILGAYAFWKKDTDPERWRLCGIFGGVLLLATIPYFINYFLFQSLPVAEEMIDRQGIIEQGRYLRTYGVIGHYVFYALMAVIVYWLFWKKEEKKSLAFIFWAMLLGIFITWNIQLIFGYTLVSNHWWFAFAPVGLLMLLAVFYELASRWKFSKAVNYLVVLLVALLVTKKIVNIFIFAELPEEIVKKYSFNPKIVASWDWINTSLPGEPKIISPVIMDSVYLSIYSDSRPYLPFYTNTLAPNSELEKRFLLSQKLFRVPTELLEKQLTWNRYRSEDCEFLKDFYKKPSLKCDPHSRFSFENGRFLYGFAYLPKEFSTISPDNYSWDITREKINQLLQSYDNLEVNWKDVEADYVYYGPLAKNLSSVNLSRQPDLELVYKNSSVEIYKIKHEDL